MPGFSYNYGLFRGAWQQRWRARSSRCRQIAAELATEVDEQIEHGAGNEARTRDLNLGKVALYQLSYSRGVQSH